MIVMKFGGSSVQDATAIRRVARLCLARGGAAAGGGERDGRRDRQAGTGCRNGLQGEASPALAILEAIRARHLQAAGEMLNHGRGGVWSRARRAACRGEELTEQMPERDRFRRQSTLICSPMARCSERAGNGGLRGAGNTLGAR